MNCKRIRSKLDLLAGDDLAGRDAAEVEAHLRQCLTCYREYVELRDLLAEVRAARRPDDAGRRDDEAESFVQDVMAQIHGPPPAAPRLLPRLTMASGWAAALIFGLTAGWLHWQLRQPDPRRADPRIIQNGNGSGVTSFEQDLDRELNEQFGALRGESRNALDRPSDDLKPASVRKSTKSY